jgi:hypothetical protein
MRSYSVTVETADFTFLYFSLNGFKSQTRLNHICSIIDFLPPYMVESQNDRVTFATIRTRMCCETGSNKLPGFVPGIRSVDFMSFPSCLDVH